MAIALDPHLLADLSSGSGEHSGGSIWRDAHIQRQLLAAHLDHSTTAATRSRQAVRRTIDLLTLGLAPGACVLDLGCGPGRYAQQLADDGYDVTGVDYNQASIEYARQHARGRVQYIESDYTRDLPEGRFDLAMLIYLDFGTHVPEVQRALLREAHNRLGPGGRLVLDYLDAAVAERHRPGRSWEASGTGGFWAPGPHLVLSETTVEPQALAQRIRYTLLTEGDVRRFDVWEHCFSDDTMHTMLADAGFTDVSLHRGVLAGSTPKPTTSPSRSRRDRNARAGPAPRGLQAERTRIATTFAWVARRAADRRILNRMSVADLRSVRRRGFPVGTCIRSWLGSRAWVGWSHGGRMSILGMRGALSVATTG